VGVAASKKKNKKEMK